VRLDSGDLLSLSREARRLLDDTGMREAAIVASGDLEEVQIARLVAAGAPIDTWGVGTELGTSRDAPALGGVYKLVADAMADGSGWRPVWKRSPAKATIPGPKQVFRSFRSATMVGDLVAEASERQAGRPLLEEDCVTLEADAYVPAQLATMGSRMVLRRAEESVARTTTAPCGQD
jgi:nicotinate phosphoribosyltransferase